MNIVCAFHLFLGGVFGVNANPLEQFSKLVDVGRVPRLGQAGADGAVSNALAIQQFRCQSQRGLAGPTGLRAGPWTLPIVQ